LDNIVSNMNNDQIGEIVMSHLKQYYPNIPKPKGSSSHLVMCQAFGFGIFG
jgi:hypothetical protein